MEEFIESLSKTELLLIILAAGLVVGLIAAFVLNSILSFTAKKSEFLSRDIVSKHLFSAGYLLLSCVGIFVIFLMNPREAPLFEGFQKAFQLLTIAAAAWYIIRSANVFEAVILKIYSTDKEDNNRERRIVTQLNFIKRAVKLFVGLLAFSLILFSFEEARKFGAGMLASAGVASIILGLAAQKTLGNLIAGVQIAFTQPIKIDDAVIVEGEWGKVEEINLTYVVVKIWDLRRLVLPINYFIEKPFQNWTRNEADLIGSVYIYSDYRIPVEKVRNKLEEILQGQEYWDREVWGLQVVDSSSSTIAMRAIMSAGDSGDAWNLRCAVREEIMKFLGEEYEQYLPKTRVELQEDKQLEESRE